MTHNSCWIWTGAWSQEHEMAPTSVLFRKKIKLNSEITKTNIEISADSRYKLYVNGTFVEAGPSKGDSQIWFYDEMDISPYLLPGENVLAVVVLKFPMKPTAGNQSIITTHTPGLYLKGDLWDKEGGKYEIIADGTWKCRIDGSTRFVSEAEGFAPLHFYEEVSKMGSLAGWKETVYDDSDWEDAFSYPKPAIRYAVSPGNLNKRTIPFMRRRKGRFLNVIALRKSTLLKEEWDHMLSGDGSVFIAPYTEEVVEIDAGEEMTGYLHLFMEQGDGAEIKLLQSESYIQPGELLQGMTPLKTDRMDAQNGILEGFTDCYHPTGIGDANQPEEYEPFWFRTFRFIRLQITTGEKPLTIKDFYYEETGYPLEMKSHVETSDESLSAVWEISARTLQRCMHETYMDCPFYEQLQYVMDSRAQILFTYAVSMDDRLAKKCMDDFKRAQRYDGLICSAYPNTKPNVIPGFSIFYILMLHDHMMYFGDKEQIRSHMPAVEEILNFFQKNRTKYGYVGKLGGYLRQEKYWSFIDWVPDWTTGVPDAIEQGPLTIESLYYLMGLLKAADLAEYIGRTDLEREYRQTAGQVRQSIRDYCMNPEGFIKDGPGCFKYSQHCQVFGVLTGVLDIQTGRKNILETLKHPDSYAQCTVSMSLYLFRAMELSGLYEETKDCWNIWRKMIDNHMTTVAESDVYPRSECHAWGALALYELPAVVLGVRPAAPGFKKISVHPVPGYYTWAKGEAVTPNGMISVEWKKNGTEGMEVTVAAEEKVMAAIEKENGFNYVLR